jgi:UDP:flavonoid glycosyltransferase YjiC (YdhE family)
VNLKQAADECTIFIHNGNHDMAYELLSYGVPSIILPSKPDQVMLAYQLAEQGLAFVGPEFSELLDISALIQVAKNEDQVWLNCSNLQMKYENHQSLHRLHDLVKAELLA